MAYTFHTQDTYLNRIFYFPMHENYQFKEQYQHSNSK